MQEGIRLGAGPRSGSTPLRHQPIRAGMNVLGVALSGMQSAHTRLAASAHNVANLLTEDFRPLRARQVSLESGGSRALVEQAPDHAPVSLEREVVGQIEASVQYTASLRVFEAGAELRGTLVDLLA